MFRIAPEIGSERMTDITGDPTTNAKVCGPLPTDPPQDVSQSPDVAYGDEVDTDETAE